LSNGDPLGLVVWKGYAHGLGLGHLIFAGARYNLHLVSECVNGVQATVDLDVHLSGAGLGFPVTYTISHITFDDGRPNVDPGNLVGLAALVGAGFSVGGGASYSSMQVGLARSDFGWAGQGGWDASMYSYPLGYSSFDGAPKIRDCGCEQ